MMYDMQTTIQLPDEEDVDVHIDFEVTSWGSPGCGPSFSSPGEPPDPPEFGIVKIFRLDNDAEITAQYEALDYKYQEKILELVLERIFEIEQSRDYYEYDG